MTLTSFPVCMQKTWERLLEGGGWRLGGTTIVEGFSAKIRQDGRQAQARIAAHELFKENTMDQEKRAFHGVI